ncbi:MAG: FAD-binding oxidoreductase [Chloracidobacterium sp.]|nr:FAD-binding oxidoreductase [Chloracidobacterium sp.]MCO5334796.1 FAD-binding oxidoreductase [Pyrinomonadaceae bacterium]
MQERKLIYPPAVAIGADEAESLENWGFQDTSFTINGNGNVAITGSRYELSGKELPRLLPWIRETLDIDLDVNDRFEPHYPPEIAPAVKNAEFLKQLTTFLSEGQIDAGLDARVRHGHGHTQEEMFEIKYGRIGRIPDAVVFPETEEQVASLIVSAKQYSVVLIPFGGGTNVTDALRCRESESRMIVSVDMRRMNRIRWIDTENRTACIEAGAVGRHIMSQLENYGVTMGHEPDSVEFSTLGGWIATHASGMKKNKYGNIEDIVIDMTVAAADGTLQRLNQAPRESIGMDIRRLIFGSEGTLGIVTSAVVKLFPLPEVQEYGSVLFPAYEDGYAFMHDLVMGSTPPASCRLVDNLQFQFGLALKPASNSAAADLMSKVQKFFVTKIKGFDPYKMVALTLVFEGTRDEVERQQRDVYRIAKRHGGMKAGGDNGRRGYQLTYSIAYIRDFLMNYYIIAESFETSCQWSDALAICENVKRVLLEEYAKRGLPGKPFVTSRITQLYRTGVAIYFYFGFYFKGIEQPSKVYLDLENIAREEILRCGGSLSHHHGVGKIRRQFMPEIMSETSLQWKTKLKEALDPSNIFASGNQDLG